MEFDTYSFILGLAAGHLIWILALRITKDLS